jgi:hypothetical protein
MSERMFTVAAADALLPELRERLPRLAEARRALIDASERVSAKVASESGGVAEPAWFDAKQTLAAELTSLAALGVILRDPEMGLVDFPAERDGERVYLCWMLGEDSVAHYHGEQAGMNGRMPL